MVVRVPAMAQSHTSVCEYFENRCFIFHGAFCTKVYTVCTWCVRRYLAPYFKLRFIVIMLFDVPYFYLYYTTARRRVATCGKRAKGSYSTKFKIFKERRKGFCSNYVVIQRVSMSRFPRQRSSDVQSRTKIISSLTLANSSSLLLLLGKIKYSNPLLLFKPFPSNNHHIIVCHTRE